MNHHTEILTCKLFHTFLRLICSPGAVVVSRTFYVQVVELVDTKDLKSFDHCGRAGSNPAPDTTVRYDR